MISNAVALAILTTIGCVIVFKKLPRRIRRIITKYSLLTDLLTLIGTYLILGGTLTALFAAAICGIFVSGLLYIANNEQDFLYLYDLKLFLREKLREAKEALNRFGEAYREKKMQDSKFVNPQN